MKISIIIHFLSLMVRDVFSVRGFYSAEVAILPEGDVPTDAEDEVTCTMASIEPAGTDVKFMKYIASPEEVIAKPCLWRDNSTAQTFEDCADAAAASGSKMFLYDKQRCRISDGLFEQTDLCTKDHSLMVYMDVDADTTEVVVPETKELFCNYDWTTTCKDDRQVNTLTYNGQFCAEQATIVIPHEGLYHLIGSGYAVKAEDHYAECAKYGALPCAPEDDSIDLTTFVNQLKQIEAVSNRGSIGLNSTDDGATFVWATGVVMSDTALWREPPSGNKYCAILVDGKMVATFCTYTGNFCCMVPYYAD